MTSMSASKGKSTILETWWAIALKIRQFLRRRRELAQVPEDGRAASKGKLEMSLIKHDPSARKPSRRWRRQRLGTVS
jgi:hypothetical protein